MAIFRVPSAFPFLFRNLVWKQKTKEKVLFLTFDDGPIDPVTPFVLDLLAEHKVKATFFCLGKNVEAYRPIYERILREGHSAGNHSYSHCNGWKTRTSDYLKDVEKCSSIVSASFFRPPYGKLKWSQYRNLKQKYTIVMWDLLSYDFDPKLDREEAIKKLIALTRPGSIVVFHDSFKAERNLRYLLPRYITHFKSAGYSFQALPSTLTAKELTADPLKEI